MLGISATAIAFIVGILADPASALGINCRGSGLCNSLEPDLSDMMQMIDGHLDPNHGYIDGATIACEQSLCIFVKGNANPLFSNDVMPLLNRLYNHGCRVCGSVPFNTNNDPSDGILVSNYVLNMPCTGLCP